MNPMKVVSLINGGVVVLSEYFVTYMILENMLKTKPVVFYDLVMVARDAEYTIYNDHILDDLVKSNLVDKDGKMRGDTRNIINSVVNGSHSDMVLIPAKEGIREEMMK